MKPHAMVCALMTFVRAGCAVAGHAVRERAIAQTCREPGPHDPATQGQRICDDGLGNEQVRPNTQTS